MTPPLSRPGLRRPRAMHFIATFGLLFLSMVAWSLATPLFAAPDEPTHVVRAVGVVTGQPYSETVSLPSSLARIMKPASCPEHRRPFASDCLRRVDVIDGQHSRAASGAFYNSPFYYALVGMPLRVAPNQTGVYLTRLVGALACAALIAVALAVTRRGIFRVALLFGVTPTAVFLSGSVNPNGLEIAAATLVWASALRLTSDSQTPRFVIHSMGVGAVCLGLARPLGIVWLANAVIVAIFIGDWMQVKRLSRDRALWLWLGPSVLLSVASSAWGLRGFDAGTESAGAPGISTDIWRAREPYIQMVRLRESLGTFGWNDMPSPAPAYGIWVLMAALAVFLVVRSRAWRTGIALLAMTTLLVTVPAYIDLRATASMGFFWQGRYSLPVIVAFPLLVAIGYSRSDYSLPTGLRLPVHIGAVLTLGLVQTLSFLGALTAYVHGPDSQYRVIANLVYRPWHPHLAGTLFLCVLIIGIVAHLRGIVRPASPGAPHTGLGKRSSVLNRWQLAPGEGHGPGDGLSNGRRTQVPDPSIAAKSATGPACGSAEPITRTDGSVQNSLPH
jgi:hypothetical protein